MSDRAPYSRVYWSIIDDPKFVTIYDDNNHFATWTRLLLIADQAYPASAHMPGNVRKTSLQALVDAQIVDLIPGGRYRIHGLDAERERRKALATTRVPDGDRTVTTRVPDGFGTQGLSRAEQRQEEQSTDDAPEWPALQWLVTHNCSIRPGDGYHRKLVTAVEVHGIAAILEWFDRLAKAGVKRGDTKGFVFGAIDALNEPSRPKLRAVEASATHDRGVERTKIRAHENGLHEGRPNAGCPRCAA